MIDLRLGDALVELRQMPDNSIDAICADPPAGINFMGAKFDSDRGGRDHWIAWLAEIMREAMRVTKPGGHAFVWALPKTSHWTAMALEDAGWEVREKCYHLFGSGFPKSMDISKQIDKHGGVDIAWFGPWLRIERERRGIAQKELAKHFPSKSGNLTGCVANWELGFNLPTPEQFNTLCRVLDLPFDNIESAEREVIGISPNGFGPNNGASLTHTMKAHPNITAPATDLARQWAGWGTATKPAAEEWILVRKPLERGLTIAGNVARWGVGAINVDASRIGQAFEWKGGHRTKPIHGGGQRVDGHDYTPNAQGRFPSNILLSHISPDPDGSGGCVEVGTKRVKSNERPNCEGKEYTGSSAAPMNRANGKEDTKPVTVRYADADGCEVVSAFQCVPGCPVAILDAQAGVSKSTANKTSDGRQHAHNQVYGDGKGWGRRDPSNSYTDSGQVSRFFKTFPPEVEPAIDVPWIYMSKASRRERNAGCEGLPEQSKPVHIQQSAGRQLAGQNVSLPQSNSHPTVKSLALMDYLITMITPPNGTVLDMFMGSGSTGCSAVRLGFDFVGIEMEPEYMAIAQARIDYHDRLMRGELTTAEIIRAAKRAFIAAGEEVGLTVTDTEEAAATLTQLGVFE